MKETNIQKLIRVAASDVGFVLWRNNVGVAYQGKARWDRDDVLLMNARRITFGVGGAGGSDLIGYKTITITPEMVGKEIAVFTAVEIKKPTKKPTDDQQHYLDTVDDAGGVAIVARSDEDFLYPKRISN